MSTWEETIRQTFLDEAAQLLLDAEQTLLLLEASPAETALVDRLFRIAHNLKGSAKAVNLDDFGNFMHELESLLLRMKRNVTRIDSDNISLLLSCNDLLTSWIGALKDDPQGSFDFQDLMKEVSAVGKADVNSSESSAYRPEAGGLFDEEPCGKSIPVSKKEMDKAPSQDGTVKDGSLRVSLKRVDGLINDVGELVILQTVLKQHKHLIHSDFLQKNVDQLSKITRHIQEAAMRLRMVPLQPTFQKMHRILRDCSRSLGKDIRLHMSGEHIEMDKSVVDSLSDPLTHIIRNAVDHGIENPDERQASDKGAQGNIWLSAQQLGERLVIEIRDDGRGLDVERIRRKAIENGVLGPQDEISDQEAYQLIFAPGFSTKAEVTELSGRGVGLDVVKTNITQLKGELQLEAVLGRGTLFRILIPLTLAVIDAMVVRVNDSERYIIPSSQVREILELCGSEVREIKRGREVINLRGEAIPLFRLAQELNRKVSDQGDGTKQVVIISKTREKQYGFLAESVVCQQQIVIKRLGNDLKKIRGISGSAVLGDGKAALILDLEEIGEWRSA